MFGNLGFGEILLIALIALLLFGPAKLPELGRALGRTLREFKQGARDLMSTDETEQPAQQQPRKDVTPPAAEAPAQPSAEQPQAAAGQPEKPAADNRRLPD
ncbi:twin-arginine translocase TatA/TatE family subunit [Paenibacillus sp. GD4]|uniref:twin-arginine translocase TatA/TatE family subunit n=1 Tax=Paenibacillus sp. GD4 TaxID=3068890 RepID=UPI0027969D6D|nr:twin-arginine translocase TatA/TatE family subunit [Paenibacillus sp. GD4]MDQ1911619.1 twin-arginine translocase TatA/TatE family subunit [Paenibacillus sp. GD4]